MNIVKRVDRLEKLWKSMSINIEQLVTKVENFEKKITEHEARLDVNEHYIGETEEKIQRNSKELEARVIFLDNERVAKCKNDHKQEETLRQREILSLREELDKVSNKIIKIDKDIILLDEQSKKVSENVKKVTPKRKIKECQVECDHCDEKFDSHSSIEMHLKNLNVTKQFKCSECEMSLHTKWRLNKHKKMHQSSSKIRKCHFFNSGKICPFEQLGCKFKHEYSDKCKFGEKCTFHMCHFKHC